MFLNCDLLTPLRPWWASIKERVRKPRPVKRRGLFHVPTLKRWVMYMSSYRLRHIILGPPKYLFHRNATCNARNQTQDTWLVQPVLCYWAAAAGQPPALPPFSLSTSKHKRYYIIKSVYKRGTISSCTKEVLYTVNTDVPRHLKHFKVGGAGCQFSLLQPSDWSVILPSTSLSLPLPSVTTAISSSSIIPPFSSFSTLICPWPVASLLPLWKGMTIWQGKKPYWTMSQIGFVSWPLCVKSTSNSK